MEHFGQCLECKHAIMKNVIVKLFVCSIIPKPLELSYVLAKFFLKEMRRSLRDHYNSISITHARQNKICKTESSLFAFPEEKLHDWYCLLFQVSVCASSYPHKPFLFSQSLIVNILSFFGSPSESSQHILGR